MKAQDLTQVRRTLWAAADEMRANSSLTPPEYRGPVLGLIFLAYAEQRFDETAAVEETDEQASADHVRRLPTPGRPLRSRLSQTLVPGRPPGKPEPRQGDRRCHEGN